MKRIFSALALLCIIATTALAAGPPTGPWRPEITERPRLLFEADDLALMQDRITREPYTTLMTRVRSRANAGYNPTIPDPYNASREYGNANIAKAAAFVAWIDNDAAKADKAASVLEVLGADFGNPLVIVSQDIHIAEALLCYAQAYDILAGTGLIDPTRLAAIEDRLALMVENIYRDFFDLLAVWQIYSVSNHSIKITSALAVAAMAMNQHPDANKWFNYGMTDTWHKLFDLNVSEGGAYAEGTYYGTYSAVNHLPLFVMYDRLVGEDMTLLDRGFCLLGPNCPWQEIELTNPLDNPKLYEMSLWYTKIRLPTGDAPPLDDANMEGFFNGMMSGTWQDGLLAWDWLNNTHYPLFVQHCADLAVDTIAFYDDTVTVTPPDEDFGPHFILPTEGQAVFRSGWEPDDTWAMFIAEYGLDRTVGHGHEHPDNLSISLFARGQYLLIDPGYIAWEEHTVVNKGEHHNVPTVDGKGPPGPTLVTPIRGEEAYIIDGLTDSAVPFARGVTEYFDAAFDRVIFMPESDYLIAVDDMVSAEPRTFGVLWHGHAGGDSGYPFTLLADGGTWEREGAAADVRVATTAGGLTLDTLTNIHGFTWMQQEEHTSLDIRATEEAERARFISIGLPYAAAAEEDPRPVTWLNREGIAAARIEGDDLIFVLAQAAPAHLQLTAAETGSVSAQTNMETLLISTDATAEAGYAYVDGGSYLILGARQPWLFSREDRVWLEWSGDIWTFDFPPDGMMIGMLCDEPPLIEGDPAVQWDLRAGLLRIWATEAARFTVTL
ncbi:MAG: heparinase II/III domain-containing protein [Alphaproteobacteria bacterium]